MKAEYINPFLIASERIFKLVLLQDLTLGKISLQKEYNIENNLVAIIWIEGDFFGRAVLCLKRETAYKIASKMMKKRVLKLDEMSRSAIGELANMILGRTGTIFSNKGINVKISPPTIIEADKLSIPIISDGIINIPMKVSDEDIIDLKIEIKMD